MWVMLIVSVVNTPLNVFIIKYANPAVQLPLAQVISQLLRMIWWAIILKWLLSLKQYTWRLLCRHRHGPPQIAHSLATTVAYYKYSLTLIYFG